MKRTVHRRTCAGGCLLLYLNVYRAPLERGSWVTVGPLRRNWHYPLSRRVTSHAHAGAGAGIFMSAFCTALTDSIDGTKLSCRTLACMLTPCCAVSVAPSTTSIMFLYTSQKISPTFSQAPPPPSPPQLVKKVIREIKPQVVMLELDAESTFLLPPGEACQVRRNVCTPLSFRRWC